jgi:hypothetical protein
VNGLEQQNLIYKSVRNAKERDARKPTFWDLQKEKGWKIIIDYLSLDVQRDLLRVSMFEKRMRLHNVRWLWFEVRKVGTGQGSFNIARCMKKLQGTTIEGEAWRACYDEFLSSWNKIELMPGTWECYES